MHYYLDVLKKYAVFSGRESRKAFWMFFLFHLFIIFLLAFIEAGLTGGDTTIPVAFYGLAVFLPALGVTIRRLHDTGRSGWWVLIALIPILGHLILLILLALEGQSGTNEYGPNPKEAPAT